MVNDCAFWHSETIVVTYGVMLANPLALITEYFPLGALDFYLQLNRSKLQEIDLVEAATYLANALWYLVSSSSKKKLSNSDYQSINSSPFSRQ